MLPSFDWSFTFGFSPFRIDPFSFSPYVKVIGFSPPDAKMLVVFVGGAWATYVATLSSVLFTRSIVRQGQDPTSFLASQTLIASGHF